MTAQDLKEYGKVEVCEEVNGEFHIKITEGFSSKATNVFLLMNFIDIAIGKKYNKVVKCVTDENMFDYKLKP